MATHEDNLLSRQQHKRGSVIVDDLAASAIGPGKEEASSLLFGQSDQLLKEEKEETNRKSDLDCLSSVFGGFLSSSQVVVSESSVLFNHESHQDSTTVDTAQEVYFDSPLKHTSRRDDFGSSRVEGNTGKSREESSPLRSIAAPASSRCHPIASKSKATDFCVQVEDKAERPTEKTLDFDQDSPVDPTPSSPFRGPKSLFASSIDTPTTESSSPSFDSLPDDLPLKFSFFEGIPDSPPAKPEKTPHKLEDVSGTTRSQLFLKPPRPTKRSVQTMASVMTSKQPRKNTFRQRLSLSRARGTQQDDENASAASNARSHMTRGSSDSRGINPKPSTRDATKRANSADDMGPVDTEKPRRGVLQRLRSVSRSRSVSRNVQEEVDDQKPILVAVTSCRSDAYHNQKAPGSTSKLPRKAPSNLKLFHELAIGVKDAYAAVGKTPKKPDDENSQEEQNRSSVEREGRRVLWEFIGHLDFVSFLVNMQTQFSSPWQLLHLSHHTFASLQLLSLVDEVAVDTATRGALKDDTTFKGLRDVIKKCNKVLEGMLVRRERRYTLFFRLIQWSETKEVVKLKAWNGKVEKAVGQVADSGNVDESDTESDAGSVQSSATESSSQSGRSGRAGMFARGRQLLPAAGKVRGRRATPTPALRNRTGQGAPGNANEAAEDGFAAQTPSTANDLAGLQRSMSYDSSSGLHSGGMAPLMAAVAPAPLQLAPAKMIEPKDELIDVIRGLRAEQKMKREGTAESDLASLKPNWLPKAEIPSSVPKLPTEYIHRHRLMKQVVTCLLEQSGSGPIDTDNDTPVSAECGRYNLLFLRLR
jgi:hypothetical protein